MILGGRYELAVVRKGTVIHRACGRNVVVATGETLTASRFKPTAPPAAIDWIEFGSGSTQPLSTDVDLETTLVGTRTQSSSDIAAGNSITYTFSFTAGGNLTIKEAGLFNNPANGPASGVMAARFLTQTFNMVSGDVLNITWELTFKGID